MFKNDENTSVSKNIIKNLPYLEYLSDSNLFVLKDKSLGVIYKLESLDHAPMTFEEIKSYGEALELLVDLPQNCVTQVFSYQSVMSTEDISGLARLPWDIESNAADFFRNKRIEALSDKSKDGSLLKREIYLSIRFLPEKSPFDILSLIP